MVIHIRRGSDAYGPYSLEEVRTYLGDGRLAADDLASTDGVTGWLPLAALLGGLADSAMPGAEGWNQDVEGTGGTATAPAPTLAVPHPMLAGTASRYPPAPLGPRVGACLLDTLVAFACFLPALAVYAVQGEADAGLLFGALVIGGAGGALVYSFVKDGMEGGASLGKRAVGLMVVHLATNQPCSGSRSALRTLIWNVTNFVPLVGWLIEPVTAMVSADRRRLGDHAAGTQVIRAADYRL